MSKRLAKTHVKQSKRSLGKRLREFFARVRDGIIIHDVPLGLDECESCREVECTQGHWLACSRRLASCGGDR
jgi:hypothetical protein